MLPEEQFFIPSIPFALVPERIGLYAVVDSLQWVERLISLNVKTVQLRIKNKSALSLKLDICAAIKLAKQHDVHLYINDHWQLAIECNAYGIHLGQEDISSANLQQIHQAGLRLGISTHTLSEINRILPIRPSYIALGHIFATKTKVMPSVPQGLEALRRQVAYLSTLPSGPVATVAIGGISLKNIDDVLATGVGGIAVVSAITQAFNWQEATQKLLEKCAVN